MSVIYHFALTSCMHVSVVKFAITNSLYLKCLRKKRQKACIIEVLKNRVACDIANQSQIVISKFFLS